MKSKLFLALSLLTAAFSVSANTVAHTSDRGAWMIGSTSHDWKQLKFDLNYARPYAKVATLGLGATAAMVYGIRNLQKPVEVKPTMFERAKAQFNKGLSFVKEKPVKSAGIVAATVVAGIAAYKGAQYLFGKNTNKVVEAPKAVTPVVEAPKKANFRGPRGG